MTAVEAKQVCLAVDRPRLQLIWRYAEASEELRATLQRYFVPARDEDVASS
jgi:hypothetical protein